MKEVYFALSDSIAAAKLDEIELIKAQDAYLFHLK
jgi:hypothetical protein